MYLHSFCDNFESKVLDYMNNNQITPTDCSKNLKDSTYYHSVESFSHSPDQSFSNFYVMSDPIQFIQSFFKLNDKVIHEIKDIVSLVGKFFKTGKRKLPLFQITIVLLFQNRLTQRSLIVIQYQILVFLFYF